MRPLVLSLALVAVCGCANKKPLDLVVAYEVDLEVGSGMTHPGVRFEYVDYPGRGSVVFSTEVADYLGRGAAGTVDVTYVVDWVLGCGYDLELVRVGELQNPEVGHTWGSVEEGTESPFGWCN